MSSGNKICNLVIFFKFKRFGNLFWKHKNTFMHVTAFDQTKSKHNAQLSVYGNRKD